MSYNISTEILSTVSDEVDTFQSARTDDVWDVYYNQQSEVDRYGYSKYNQPCEEVVD